MHHACAYMHARLAASAHHVNWNTLGYPCMLLPCCHQRKLQQSVNVWRRASLLTTHATYMCSTKGICMTQDIFYVHRSCFGASRISPACCHHDTIVLCESALCATCASNTAFANKCTPQHRDTTRYPHNHAPLDAAFAALARPRIPLGHARHRNSSAKGGAPRQKLAGAKERSTRPSLMRLEALMGKRSESLRLRHDTHQLTHKMISWTPMPVHTLGAARRWLHRCRSADSDWIATYSS